MYPSLMEMLNCSKETKLSTVLRIDNSGRLGIINVDEVEGPLDASGTVVPQDWQVFNVEDFFVNSIYAYENAVYVEHEFFNLPDYTEMYHLTKDLPKQNNYAELPITI